MPTIKNEKHESDTINPFVHTLVLSPTDKLLICINAVLLLPIRLFTVLIMLFFCSVLANLMTVGLSEQELNENPFNGWRRLCKKIIKILCRTIAFCCGFHFIIEKGKRVSRARAPILVCGPHVSFFDTFILFLFDIPCTVSRLENAQVPIIGTIIRAMQPILVDRQDAKSKSHVTNEIKKRSQPDTDWSQMAIFPEGTTTNGTCLINFKPGAFLPGMPVQPVLIEYQNRLNIFPWTMQGLNAYQIFFLTLCQFNNCMQITYMKVHTPNKTEIRDANVFASSVRRKMANKLDLVTTEHTYEDCLLMIEAKKLNMPMKTGLIEFAHLKAVLNMSYQDCKLLIALFALKYYHGVGSFKEFLFKCSPNFQNMIKKIEQDT